MWERIDNTIGQKSMGRRSLDEVKGSLTRCYMSCSGGLLDKVDSDADEKHRACAEAVHWNPITFSASDKTVDSCHFYPQKSEELQKSACFWGNCIDTSDMHAAVWPSWGLQLNRQIDDPIFNKNLTARCTLPSLFVLPLHHGLIACNTCHRTHCMLGSAVPLHTVRIASCFDLFVRLHCAPSGARDHVRRGAEPFTNASSLARDLCDALRREGDGLAQLGRGGNCHARHVESVDGVQCRRLARRAPNHLAV